MTTENQWLNDNEIDGLFSVIRHADIEQARSLFVTSMKVSAARSNGCSTKAAKRGRPRTKKTETALAA